MLKSRDGLFWGVVALLVAWESHAVFIDRSGTFRIEGDEPIALTEFADGRLVRQAFLMEGAGLQQVRVRLNSRRHASLPVHWTLWRGNPDLSKLMPVFDATQTVNLRPGSQWVAISFSRDNTSQNRWYTFDVRAVGGEAVRSPENPAEVSIWASNDNPDRGGVLWVDDVRKPGSLFIRADRVERTPYRRFLLEATPNLPAPLRIRAVHWLVLGLVHIAVIVFAYSVLMPGRRGTAARS